MYDSNYKPHLARAKVLPLIYLALLHNLILVCQMAVPGLGKDEDDPFV